MRRVATFLLAAGLVFVASTPADAEPPSSDPIDAAKYAASWLARQVTSDGFIESSFTPGTPDLSVSAQAVTALAAAAVGRAQVDALLGYLGGHVDDFVARDGADAPAALAYLVLAAVAGGVDPAAFGTPATNLVARLQATQQPGGVFGTADATFDGAFRQGLALLALDAVGIANAAGTAWLADQQCDDGLWTAFRADTSVACPPVDPSAFTGPDTNSTALAVAALHAHGVDGPAATGATALDSVRNAAGGWGYLARSDQATDANSTGVVLLALRAVDGAPDAAGVAALLHLQVGCTADPLDRGGIAFQPAPGGALAPDALATAQATPALAGAVLPLGSSTITDGLVQPCVVAASTTTTVAATPTTGAAVDAAADSTSDPSTQLPRTGSASGAITTVGVAMLASGLAALVASRRSRARPLPGTVIGTR
jgi:LPXTG-motif cell wall-anchored protein